jgi:hypothetical protein
VSHIFTIDFTELFTFQPAAGILWCFLPSQRTGRWWYHIPSQRPACEVLLPPVDHMQSKGKIAQENPRKYKASKNAEFIIENLFEKVIIEA